MRDPAEGAAVGRRQQRGGTPMAKRSAMPTLLYYEVLVLPS
jgi:hypothetical protein